MAADRMKLGTVCSKIGSGATPRGGKGAYKGGATALIRSQNIYNDGFHRDGLAFINDQQAAQLSNVDVQPDDVLLNITGDSVARCCQVARDVLPARVNQHVAIIRPQPDKLDARFLRYVLASPDYQAHLLALASAGATRNALTKGMIESLVIEAPVLPDQKAIARILGMLDDKIELGRRMNETLQAMARALFQSWFVHCDPVRAKLDGRKPAGLDEDTAALFPSSFEVSTLGDVPTGWKVGVFDNLIDFVIGGDWGGNEATPGADVPCYCIRGADIPDLQSGGVGKMPVRFLKPSSVQKRQLRSGDLAIEISGGSPTQCTGRPVLVSDGLLEGLGTPLVASNFCRIVKLKSPAYSKFAYLWIRSLYDAGLLFQFETGTTGIKNFGFVRFAEAHPLVIPEYSVLDAFDKAVAPLFARIQANAAQSRILASLRDTLLPKLLSGELSVAGLEKEPEHA